MPLTIIIIGAGIAGLTAAISLRKAGHHVEVRAPISKPGPGKARQGNKSHVVNNYFKS